MYVATGPGDDIRERDRQLIKDISSVLVSGSEQSHVLSGLDKWTKYKIWVAAASSAGEGPMSDVIVVQTDEDGKCTSSVVNLCMYVCMYVFIYLLCV